MFCISVLLVDFSSVHFILFPATVYRSIEVLSCDMRRKRGFGLLAAKCVNFSSSHSMILDVSQSDVFLPLMYLCPPPSFLIFFPLLWIYSSFQLLSLSYILLVSYLLYHIFMHLLSELFLNDDLSVISFCQQLICCCLIVYKYFLFSFYSLCCIEVHYLLTTSVSPQTIQEQPL